MQFESVIGLEIHVQLKTKSKMFCRCSNRGEYESPNTTVCPVCLGQPGTLPVINAKAVEFGVMAGLALGSTITPVSKFDRKQYFYPDLPKGYQISQFDLPVVQGGMVMAKVKNDDGTVRDVRVRIHRLHLEEDAAKLVHGDDGKSSFVDYNRAGTPLAEIVTEPDMRHPAEARAFLQELRLIMRYLGVSDADMEKGHLRCDANISLRPVGDTKLYPKTEVKNINSFKAVERALEFEIKRQTKMWLDDKPPSYGSTRGWDDPKGITVEQRTKEDASDYRFFPEPDLPPLHLTAMAEELRTKVPELPEQRRRRFMEEYRFSEAEARTFCDDKDLADYAEQVMSELSTLVEHSTKDWDANKDVYSKLVSGWILTKLNGVMAEHKVDIRTLKVTPDNFAELLALVHEKKVTAPNAVLILAEMLVANMEPDVIMQEKNLGASDDTNELLMIAANVIVANPKAIEDWKGGKTNAVQFLVGQMMKASRGKARPDTAREMIEAELKKL